MFSKDLIADHLCHHGYYIIDHFFEPEHYQKLLALAHQLYQKGTFKNARIGSTNQVQHNTLIRNDDIYWLDESTADFSIQLYLQRMKDIAHILNQTLFLSLCDFETHLAVYQPGSFYKKHVDQFITNKTRKISCVYYLNEYWQESFGGILKLYSLHDEVIQEVAPLGNRFVCFNSELPHEVCPTQHIRYSITGWMKTR